jgi:mannuronan synthase
MGTAATRFQPLRGRPLWQMAWALLLTALLLWTLQQYQHTRDVSSSAAPLLTLGALGLWRYSWALCHWVRASYYCRVQFPALRRQANAHHGQTPPPVYWVITSYQMPTDIFQACYQRVFEEGRLYGGHVTVIASVTTAQEQDTLEAWFLQAAMPPSTRLWLQLQDGTGKRTALAEALRAVARDVPVAEALVVLMDGDTVVSRHSLLPCARLFQSCPGLGAATTNNRALVAGDHPLMAEWYDVRLSQRHVLMASLAVSRRLLVLTGRFSLFRARYATNPDFVRQVEADAFHDWHHNGAVPMVTGDDKSTWYWLLKKRVPMLYIPDVTVWSLETECSPHFVPHSVRLMRRWFGNMLRTNKRALAVGIPSMPLFVWWSLLDQRLSMWTALTAPTAVTLLSLLHGNAHSLYAYALWVLGTRSLYALGIGWMRGRFSPAWPLLLYYNQFVGSLIKVHTLFHLTRQRWTRQRTASASTSRSSFAFSRYAFEATAVLTFVYWVALMVGITDVPRF